MKQQPQRVQASGLLEMDGIRWQPEHIAIEIEIKSMQSSRELPRYQPATPDITSAIPVTNIAITRATDIFICLLLFLLNRSYTGLEYGNKLSTDEGPMW